MKPSEIYEDCPSNCLCLMCHQRCDECDQIEYSDDDMDCPTYECDYFEEW